MLTISIKSSAKGMCSPLTVNRLLNSAREDKSVYAFFWPSLVKDKEINGGKKVGVKVEPENREFLRTLKKYIRETYGIFVPYSMLVIALLRIYRDKVEREVFSLNVKGYKVGTDDFRRRLIGISEKIRKECPEIVFLQEFRVGEKEIFLRSLMKEIRSFYKVIYPKDYNNADQDRCICITLAGKNIKRCESRYITNDRNFKYRYNLLALDDEVCLNAWMPQIFTTTPDRQKMAEDMWVSVMNIVDRYSLKPVKFRLMGDLNAYKDGAFGERIAELESKLYDSKILEDQNRPTGEANVLDYAFVNKAALQTEVVRTHVESMSDLSDHKALIMRIRTVDLISNKL